MLKRFAVLTLLGTSLVLDAGCAGRTAAWQQEQATPTEAGAADAGVEMVAAGDASWAERDTLAKVDEAIASWEKAVAAGANDVATLTKLTRAYYYRADRFLRGDEGGYLSTMNKGVEWGEKALVAASPEFDEAMRGKKGKFQEAVMLVGPEGIGAMYWYASCLGKWAKRTSFPVLLGQKDNIKATMTHVLELDETFYHGGPHRYFGAYYSIAPGFAGGDTTKSDQEFTASLEISPYFLGTKVLKAEHYAVKMDDEDLFKSLLADVLAANPEEVAEIAPEMRAEQEKAKELLDNIDELF
jgi:hypothetical protein